MTLADIFLQEEDDPISALRDHYLPSPRTEAMSARVAPLLQFITSVGAVVAEEAIAGLAAQGLDTHDDFVVLTQKMDLPRVARRRVTTIIQEAVNIVEAHVLDLDFDTMIKEAAARHYRAGK